MIYRPSQKIQKSDFLLEEKVPQADEVRSLRG